MSNNKGTGAISGEKNKHASDPSLAKQQQSFAKLIVSFPGWLSHSKGQPAANLWQIVAQSSQSWGRSDCSLEALYWGGQVQQIFHFCLFSWPALTASTSPSFYDVRQLLQVLAERLAHTCQNKCFLFAGMVICMTFMNERTLAIKVIGCTMRHLIHFSLSNPEYCICWTHRCPWMLKTSLPSASDVHHLVRCKKCGWPDVSSELDTIQCNSMQSQNAF